MMRALILLHRWLGVAFCLLFAMWFASGIVMHFVPFPALSDAERIAASAPIETPHGTHGPAEAVQASSLSGVTRVKLTQRSDGPVYLISGSAGAAALHAADLSSAVVLSNPLVLAIAKDYAGHRQWDAAAARIVALKPYDQWTVPSEFDPYRPLYRVALNDGRGTELYVATSTGEAVLDTTRRQRAWNYVGSIAHWIYPAALRSHPAIWGRLVWSLSLATLVGAGAGVLIGMLRLGGKGSRFSSPYQGWQRWHHWLGLCCALFILTWIFSGWLSMDSGTLFSSGKPTEADVAAVAGLPDWTTVPQNELQQLDPQTVEAEWFAFDGRIYRRERKVFGIQRLFVAGPGAVSPQRAFLDAAEVNAVADRLAPACAATAIVDGSDSYGPASAVPDAPVYRLICGNDWFHIDGASGAVLEKLDTSRRVYRWLFGALHRLDFPLLSARPALRTALIVVLCGLGFVFSLTAVVIAWHRLLASFRPARRLP
jgi:PepSY-associated TM region